MVRTHSKIVWYFCMKKKTYFFSTAKLGRQLSDSPAAACQGRVRFFIASIFLFPQPRVFGLSGST